MPETHPEHAPGAGLKVLVVGGGLSGMASALALRQAGHDVTVFERMPELKEVSTWPSRRDHAYKSQKRKLTIG